MQKIMKGIIIVLLLSSQMTLARSISEVARIMEVSENDAEKILGGTTILIEDVEGKFSRIASSTYPYDSKIGTYGLISDTVDLFRYGKTSVIETSSLSRSSLRKHEVYNYLHTLARMSQKKNNISVKIEFGKKFYAKNIYKKDNDIGIDVDVYQLFENCYNSGDGKRCYSDITKKTFGVKVERDGSSYRVMIDSLRVKETMKADSIDGRLEF